MLAPQSCPTLWDPMDFQLPLKVASFLWPQNSPGKNTGVGSHSFLQGSLPAPRMKPVTCVSPSLAARFFTREPPRKPLFFFKKQFSPSIY